MNTWMDGLEGSNMFLIESLLTTSIGSYIQCFNVVYPRSMRDQKTGREREEKSEEEEGLILKKKSKLCL